MMRAVTHPGDVDWWRSAVVYQAYPRSFSDHDGDGTGDILGILDRLPYLAQLGIDAIWVSPWSPSPMADGGYDVSDYRSIHPDFGTLERADTFIARAHDHGLRVLIDLVPNHSSDRHPWFQAALAARPGSAERERYIFRDGSDSNGSTPPNNWPAMFGGGAWERTANPDGSPGQWYLHLFAPEQPDWNWDNPAVAEEFDGILRFWFDRGVDGFRIDVANSMAKAPGLPDLDVDPETGQPVVNVLTGTPYMNQPHVHDILRRWRTVADSYARTSGGARVFVSEAWVTPAAELARYVRHDELHTTFNFDALMCEWTAESQRNVIDLTVASMNAVGRPPPGCSPTTTRLAWSPATGDPSPGCGSTRTGSTRSHSRGSARCRRAIPMSPSVENGPERRCCSSWLCRAVRTSIKVTSWVWRRSRICPRKSCRTRPGSGLATPCAGGTAAGCRSRGRARSLRSDFGSVEHPPWLPQPAHWADLTVAAQDANPDSMLNLYRAALAERRRNPALGDGTLTWDDDAADGVLSFTREPGFRCGINFGPGSYEIPEGTEVLVSSGLSSTRSVGIDEAVWLRV